MSMKIAITNLLRQAVVTMAPEAEADQGPEFLSDGPGLEGAIFGDLTANPTVTIDLGGAVQFGTGGAGLASGTVLASDDPFIEPDDVGSLWTAVTLPAPDPNYAVLSVGEDATLGSPDHGGNDRSLSLAGGDTSATGKLPYAVVGGQIYHMAAWCMKLVDSAGVVAVRLYDSVRAKYLKPDGTWDAAATNLVTAGVDFGVTWYGINSGAGVNFTAPGEIDEDVSLQIQIYLEKSTNTVGRFDDIDISLVAAADLMMVAGNHNFPLTAVVKWATSADGVSWTDRATFAVARGQFWKILAAPVTARFHRLQMTGTPLEAVFMGDLFLGLTQELPQGPDDNISLTYAEKGQARLETPGGTEWVENRAIGAYPPRTLSFGLSLRDAAATQAAIAILVDQLRGGRYSCVIFPETVQLPWLAIYGRVPQPIEFRLSMRSGPLAGSSDPEAFEHYARVALTFIEGPGFEAD